MSISDYIKKCTLKLRLDKSKGKTLSSDTGISNMFPMNATNIHHTKMSHLCRHNAEKHQGDTVELWVIYQREEEKIEV